MIAHAMQHKPTPAELPDEWRALAAQQRRLGADSQARILDFCAAELAAALRRAGDEVLSALSRKCSDERQAQLAKGWRSGCESLAMRIASFSRVNFQANGVAICS